MNLPIDVKQLPIRAKYINEETPLLASWIEFGKGCIHSSGTGEDIFINCSPEQVEKILEARHLFCETILEIVNVPT